MSLFGDDTPAEELYEDLLYIENKYGLTMEEVNVIIAHILEWRTSADMFDNIQERGYRHYERIRNLESDQ